MRRDYFNLNAKHLLRKWDFPDQKPGRKGLELKTKPHLWIVTFSFAGATREMIEKNVSPDRFSSLLPKIEEFNALYRDITPGDRYTAAYIPETGTRLWLNDKILGGVEGGSFAAAFFAIWIGQNPVDADFRDRMLGTRR